MLKPLAVRGDAQRHIARPWDGSLVSRGVWSLGGGCTWMPSLAALMAPPASHPGPGMLNNHGHAVPANGEMSSSHSAQSMVSGSHCTPPPPYHADPSLVRCVGCRGPEHVLSPCLFASVLLAMSAALPHPVCSPLATLDQTGGRGQSGQEHLQMLGKWPT